MTNLDDLKSSITRALEQSRSFRNLARIQVDAADRSHSLEMESYFEHVALTLREHHNRLARAASNSRVA